MKCSVRGCKREAAEGFKRCQHHIDYAKKYYEDNPEVKQPGQCNRSDCPNQADPGYRSCARCRAVTKAYEDSVRPLLNERHNKYYYQVKGEVFAHYGGPKCACCGEEHIEFLSIDHINGDGAAHRQKINGDSQNGVNLYYWLKKNNFPPGFRILCLNCNFSLGHHGYCPHDSGLSQTTAAVLAKRDQTVPTPLTP